MPAQENGMGPFDENISKATDNKKDKIELLPSSLGEALYCLEQDHEYLLEGRVFSSELIESWIDEKKKEVYAVRNRLYSFEMNLYYAL